MTELFRLVQSQMSNRYSQKATSSKAKADALEKLLEDSKPSKLNPKWDALIANPFRYPIPVDPIYSARFSPPYFHRNVWYGGLQKDTAVYEFSFHFLKQRVHLEGIEETGLRTLFVCDCDLSKTHDICQRSDISDVMDRHNYEKSYEIAKSANSWTGIIYPSCRDPKKGLCAAIFELSEFSLEIKNERTIHFEYKNGTVNWYRHLFVDVSVDWSKVS